MTYAQSWLLSWSLAGMASKISPNQRKIIAIPKGESEKWAASAAFGTFYLYKVKAIFCMYLDNLDIVLRKRLEGDHLKY